MESFTVRVYGIAVQRNKVLLTAEYHEGKTYHKFPGGGLEFGEGIKDTLRRELLEEAHVEIEILEHLYTLDYFVQSQFVKDCQIIGVYYNIRLLSEISVQEEDLEYYWLPHEEVLDRLSFATDKSAFEEYASRSSA